MYAKLCSFLGHIKYIVDKYRESVFRSSCYENFADQSLHNNFVKSFDVTMVRSSGLVKLIYRFLEGHRILTILVSHEAAPVGRPVV